MDMYQLPIVILPDKNLGFHPRDSVFTPVFTPDTLGMILKNHYSHVIPPQADIYIFRNQPNCLICSLNSTKKVIRNRVDAVIQRTNGNKCRIPVKQFSESILILLFNCLAICKDLLPNRIFHIYPTFR